MAPRRIRHRHKFIMLAVILVLALGVLLALKKSFKHTSAPGQQAENLGKITKKEVNPQELPPDFPSNFPVELRARVIENYENTAENGAKQSIRKYYSERDPDKIASDFQSYLTAYGWISTHDDHVGPVYGLEAKHGTDTFYLKIEPEPRSKGVSIVTVVLSRGK